MVWGSGARSHSCLSSTDALLWRRANSNHHQYWDYSWSRSAASNGSGKNGRYQFVLKHGLSGWLSVSPIFIGASAGMAISLLIPTIPPTVGMICLMASVTVAFLKTPVSIALILAVISDTDLIPVTTLATIVSFLLTTRMYPIPAQRSRDPMTNANLMGR